MGSYVGLRKFNAEELIFDNEETKIILLFMFKGARGLIDSYAVTDKIREFAQGLLLEAVDASFALGFVHALFGSVYSPGIGMKKVLTKFGKKAAKHWFKHAAAESLMNIKIYERVRERLEASFTTEFKLYFAGVDTKKGTNVKFIDYAKSKHIKTVWG